MMYSYIGKKGVLQLLIGLEFFKQFKVVVSNRKTLE